MIPRIDSKINASTIHRLPQVFVNRSGEAILIRTLDEQLCRGLREMYLAYEPKNSFQGLPPSQDEACVSWTDHMIGNGINLVALSFEVGVVGHVALFPINEETCELLVVVSPPFQNTGIGTRLTRAAVQLAYEIDFNRVWLPVEAKNVRARRVYKKCGFKYLPAMDSRELEMSMDLHRYHDIVNESVELIMHRNVISIHIDDSCRTALELFISKRITSLPVLDNEEKLVGIISEMDLMSPSNVDAMVNDVLTRDVLSVGVNCSINKAIRLFQSMRIRCIPVVADDMRVCGVIGRKDILAFYANRLCDPPDLSEQS